MSGYWSKLPLFTLAVWCLVAAEEFTDNIQEHEWGPPPPSKRKISLNNNSLFLGERRSDDEVIFETEVDLKGEPENVLEHTVNFPKWGFTNDKIINFISIIDVNLWEEGGTATITSGGVNATHVTIHLRSQPGRHLDFQIVVRGRKS
nr:PREDICTED: uncharacterized protein LOC109031638 [Bemisia tabaci]XP_018898814.1 PREDICTED: uncharacterized protein LOC109031638 [Bemisia tabaci]XP_018898815.1 PREDICTED: uncharacterized protein LOC109031638 [Bemisia tabaci]